MQKRAATVLLATALGGALCGLRTSLPERIGILIPLDILRCQHAFPVEAEFRRTCRRSRIHGRVDGSAAEEGRRAQAEAQGWAGCRTRPAVALPTSNAIDSPIRRTQTEPAPVESEKAPAALPEAGKPAASTPVSTAPPADGLAAALNRWEGSGRSISLQAALYGTISNNPNLVALRNSNVASPEAVEVARHLPTALNPTVWIDYRPITILPNAPSAMGLPRVSSSSNTSGNHGFYHYGQQYILFSIRQPIELGHQTSTATTSPRRPQPQQWTVVQAELPLVQTYRFFQTAAYRREKLRVA